MGVFVALFFCWQQSRKQLPIEAHSTLCSGMICELEPTSKYVFYSLCFAWVTLIPCSRRKVCRAYFYAVMQPVSIAARRGICKISGIISYKCIIII